MIKNDVFSRKSKNIDFWTVFSQFPSVGDVQILYFSIPKMFFGYFIDFNKN